MKTILKKKIKRFIPPFLLEFFSAIKQPKRESEYGWFGDYATWNDAKLKCTGYDRDIILDKVTESLLKVKNGEVIYERDSVLFDEVHYSWPLLSGLLSAAVENNGKLNVLDFGGSLGSTYYQNKIFLSTAKELRWNIVEQQHFVKKGKLFFQDEELKFYESIDECLKSNSCNVLLLSGVLQYLEKPIVFLQQVIKSNFDYIIIDRTSFIKGRQSRITIQRVQPEIYDANYPCWFFNENELTDVLKDSYRLLASFEALDKSNIPETYFKGYIYKRN